MAATDSTKSTLLIVDGDRAFRTQLGNAFTKRGFTTILASSGDEALRIIQGATLEYAILGERLPDMNGLTLLDKLRSIDKSTQILLLSGYASIAAAVDAMRLGAVGYLQKPAGADEILAAFERAASPSPLQGTSIQYTAASLARTEWEHINRVLSDSGGNISEAARRLGMHRRSLQRKLKINPPRR